MDFKPGDFDKHVDIVLTEFQFGHKRRIYEGIDKVPELPHGKTERDIFKNYLLDKKLLKPEDDDRDNPHCRITVKGYAIFINGGWLKYRQHKDAVKKLRKDLLDVSLQANQSSVDANKSLIETNASLRLTNKSIRTSNFIIPLILVVTVLATCGQIAVTWYTSETRTYKLKTEQLEQTLRDKDIQLKELENEIRSLQLKGDSISQ